MNTLDEKTLTPNELTKREEIVKSLKKKRSDFVKRYGADRAKSVMYAVATKTAKAVTEESLDEATDVKTDHSVGDTVYAKHPTEKSKTMTGVVTRVGRTTYELQHKDGSKAMYPHKEVSDNFEKLNPNPYKTKKQIQREHLEQTGEFLSLDEIVIDEGKFIDSLKSNSKKLISKLNAPLDIKGLKELEADIDSRREKERKEQNNLYASKKQIQREHLEQTGEFLSLDEIVLDERIEMPQGHKYSADPITKASSEGQGRKKPQMGSKANTAAVVAAILKKTKE